MISGCKLALISAAVSGLLAVILGAFGAHALKGQLTESMLNVYHIAVQYHFYHTFGLLAAGLLLLRLQSNIWLNVSAVLFISGLILFSGSLYLLAVTGLHWLGAVTPVGGMCFIFAWLLMAIAIWRARF